MSEEYGLTSEGDFHAFFNICEDILHEELNPMPSVEDTSANFEAFFKHCEDIINEGLQSEKVVQVGCGLKPGGQRRSHSLVKALDLPPSIKKGYFAHLFNTLENSTLVGPIPPAELCGADSMHSGAHDKFIRWHGERVLDGACIKFMCTFLEDCGVCPLTESVTIATACNKAFRQRILKSETIGLIP
ncbi:hypothetical protein CBL_12830 [Carabus blaptoides fortunei]